MKTAAAPQNDQAPAADEAAALLFDTRLPFERWLLSLKTIDEPFISETSPDSDQSISLEGSECRNCEVIFDRILRVDGLLRGNIRSAYGTLVMTQKGWVEADVDVRVAIIDGYLQGNIRATEQVVLNPNARVTGNIHTPSLSVQDGAIFDGSSFPLERSLYSELCRMGAKTTPLQLNRVAI